MANDVLYQMKSHLDKSNGDKWYIGGACVDRSGVDEHNIPEKLSQNEIFAALFRQNAVVRGPDGRNLTAPQVREDIKSGMLQFFVSRTDPNPNVCDNEEEKAQSILLEEHSESSTIRCKAAGTVKTGSITKKNGYRIFGWIYFDVVDNPDFSIVKFSQRGIVMPSLEAVRQMTRIQVNEPTNSNTKICAKINKYPNCVRLQARGKGRSRRVYISMVEGSWHVRIWGVPKYPEKWIRHESDYGEGNEHAAYLSHERILASKQTPSYEARRGALSILEGDDYFVTGEEASTEEELAEDQLILSRIDLALMNNRLCSYEDEESNDMLSAVSVSLLPFTGPSLPEAVIDNQTFQVRVTPEPALDAIVGNNDIVCSVMFGKEMMSELSEKEDKSNESRVNDRASTLVRSIKLNLVPMTRLDCRKALPANIITYPEPEYLVAGGPLEYDITRAMITLEDNEVVKLGRNDLTNIKWSAVSRELCDISLESNIAYVTMKKEKTEHAVYLNGKKLNRSVGKKIPLNDSDIISLYGHTGFAYQPMYSFLQEC